MSKLPPPAPTASAIGPCPTIIQNVGRPGTGSLPRTFAPPDHPSQGDVDDSMHEAARPKAMVNRVSHSIRGDRFDFCP